MYVALQIDRDAAALGDNCPQEAALAASGVRY
jgi:hypothetical protein